MTWAHQMAIEFGQEVPGFIGLEDREGHSGYFDVDYAYQLARLAGHFGRIALQQTEKAEAP